MAVQVPAVPPRPTIRVTEIGEYIRHNSCERRFKLEINNRALAKGLPFSERLFNVLDPVLQRVGRQRENETEESLRDDGLTCLTAAAEDPDVDGYPTWDDFAASVGALRATQRAYAREIQVAGRVGVFDVQGRIDFALVLWRDGRPVLRLVECKASRKDRTYHRVQVSIYRKLVANILRESPLRIAGFEVDPHGIECAVARIDEATNRVQNILVLQPLDLALEDEDVDRLLAGGGPLDAIVDRRLDDLDYCLEAKCDGCVFNVHCLPESARQRRLELLSLQPSAIRALSDNGIRTVDDLAELALDTPPARAIRGDGRFSDNLGQAVALARSRRRTLPRGLDDPEGFEVERLPNAGVSQLPEHVIGGRRLVRVYLGLDYDYTENRVAALTAHVTVAEQPLQTIFAEVDGRWQPVSGVFEGEARRDPITGVREVDRGAVTGRDICEYVTGSWSGIYDQDNGVERQLIQSFFHRLVEAIAAVARDQQAPIHVYVWSKSEMARLVEGCARAGSALLGNLRELLGSREGLEQLLYSTVGEEVDRAYALGWTGRGLAVVTSLRWYGDRFHWRRRLNGADVDLDREFTQDIFDFKTDLALREDGSWAEEGEHGRRHKFEIRARFFDGLPAPYWHAQWGTLPPTDGLDGRLVAAIRRYERSSQPGVLREYLTARAQALRWVEERIRPKNAEIVKPAMPIADLPRFNLGVNDAARAGLDFLRLDHHVGLTDWLTGHIQPPAHRVPRGRTIPVRDLQSAEGQVTATIDLEGFDLTSEMLELRSSLGAGSFVRVSPWSGDPNRGQTLRQLTGGGFTARVISWAGDRMLLEPFFMREGRYVLGSYIPEEGAVFDHATVDESISDFVAPRVDRRLDQRQRGAHAFRWFDPLTPEVPDREPFDAGRLAAIGELIRNLEVPPRGGRLTEDQVAAVLDGLSTRVQLLLGPPGTGKTTTTAVALLARIWARQQPGSIILLATHTHMAVNVLLRRIDTIVDSFADAARTTAPLPPVQLAKAHSTGPPFEDPAGGRVRDIAAKPCVTQVHDLSTGRVLVVGGTTSAVLKMGEELSLRQPYARAADGFQAPLLLVDEASMMVFPHFLALATLVARTGDVMLAGDHRQLAPIIAHDWEREDRPPAVLYQPFASAYQAVQNISRNRRLTRAAVRESALRFTFRLPPLVRDLISRIYHLDDIDLDGLARDRGAVVGPAEWRRIWDGETGLFLVLHSEQESRESNELEAQIIREILDAAGDLPPASVAIMTPHRAQRALLAARLEGYREAVDMIDTVERLQGGERPVVIVSATASDPSTIAARVEFLLDLNRANVAFSRAQDRLIVVCSETLLNHIPAELEHYQSAMLWKSLRGLCTTQVADIPLDAYHVRILTPPFAARE